MVKPLFWTTSGARLKLVCSSEAGNFNWLFLPGGPGLGSESLLALVNILNLPGNFWLIDLPGDGSNTCSNHVESFSYWPLALMEAVSQFEHVILVAHSTGGMYALSLPELESLLSGIILLDSAPDAKWQISFGEMVKSKPIPELEVLQENYRENPSNLNLKALTIASAPYLFTSEGQLVGVRMLSTLSYNYESCEWSDKHFDRNFQSKWIPEAIPALILVGEKDLVTPLNLFREDKRFCRSNITIKSIEGAGHFPWIENPMGVAEEFDRYANQLGQ